MAATDICDITYDVFVKGSQVTILYQSEKKYSMDLVGKFTDDNYKKVNSPAPETIHIGIGRQYKCILEKSLGPDLGRDLLFFPKEHILHSATLANYGYERHNFESVGNGEYVVSFQVSDCGGGSSNPFQFNIELKPLSRHIRENEPSTSPPVSNRQAADRPALSTAADANTNPEKRCLLANEDGRIGSVDITASNVNFGNQESSHISQETSGENTRSHKQDAPGVKQQTTKRKRNRSRVT